MRILASVDGVEFEQAQYRVNGATSPAYTEASGMRFACSALHLEAIAESDQVWMHDPNELHPSAGVYYDCHFLGSGILPLV